MAKSKKLSPKQVKLVREHLLDLNATQVAISAVYDPKNAVVTASRMLTNANVAEAIAK